MRSRKENPLFLSGEISFRQRLDIHERGFILPCLGGRVRKTQQGVTSTTLTQNVMRVEVTLTLLGVGPSRGGPALS